MQFTSLKLKIRHYLILWLDALLVQAGALCGTYGLIVTIYLILKLIIGERWWIISVLNNGAHLITMFCVPAFILSLIVKRYRFPWSLYLLPGTIAFLLWYGGELLPEFPVSENQDAIEFSVMTYNIAGSYELLAMVANNEFPADIIGLQEVPRNMSGFGTFSQQGGNAIYTEFPKSSEVAEAIYRIDNSKYVSAVKREIKIQEQTVSVYSLHAYRPSLTLRPFEYLTKPRTEDLQAVADAVAIDPNPVILFCDCNFSDQSDDYQLLTLHLQDAWKEKGVGLGLTANAPAGSSGFPFLLLRSDYVWYSDEFESISIEVLSIKLSDHYPVLARLRLLVG